MDSKHSRQFISLDRPATTKLACTECRSKHIKCDGATPSCGRCQNQGSRCIYIQSRRGYNSRHSLADRRRASPRPSPPVATTFESFQDVHVDNIQSSNLQSGNIRNISIQSGNLLVSGIQPLNSSSYGTSTFNPPMYFNLFYSNFHPAHPFVLPQRHLLTLLEKSQETPLLIAAMEYIGSLYASVTEDEKIPVPSLSLSGTARNGWTVQAFLLMAIAAYTMGNAPDSFQIFKQAVDMALDIGMNQSTFARANGHNIPILEESWKRTWWELYCMDAMFAAINQTTMVYLEHVFTDVELPCEEDMYTSQDGYVPCTLKLLDLENRFFDLHDKGFSSFAHRIAAIQALKKVLHAVSQSSVDYTDDYDLADSSLRNLSLHLPGDKSELVDNQGRVDEMLFQTHMIMHSSAIYLHRPRSRLPGPMATVIPECVPTENSVSMPNRSVQYHTIQTINGAESISALVQLPGSITRHTPFFACALALSTFVQLPQLAGDFGKKENLILERIRLNVGALKRLGNVWGLVATIRDQTLVAAGQVNASVQSQQQTRELIEIGESGNMWDFLIEGL